MNLKLWTAIVLMLVIASAHIVSAQQGPSLELTSNWAHFSAATTSIEFKASGFEPGQLVELKTDYSVANSCSTGHYPANSGVLRRGNADSNGEVKFIIHEANCGTITYRAEGGGVVASLVVYHSANNTESAVSSYAVVSSTAQPTVPTQPTQVAQATAVPTQGASVLGAVVQAQQATSIAQPSLATPLPDGYIPCITYGIPENPTGRIIRLSTDGTCVSVWENPDFNSDIVALAAEGSRFIIDSGMKKGKWIYIHVPGLDKSAWIYQSWQFLEDPTPIPGAAPATTPEPEPTIVAPDCVGAPPTQFTVLNQVGTNNPIDSDPTVVRKYAGGSNERVGTLEADDSFIYLGQSMCLDSPMYHHNIYWLYIQLPDGTVGWVPEGNNDEYFVIPAT
jgi:hypothetical protein